MSATKTTTKPSASARALRHASRAASAPAPEAPTHPTPQPQASLLAVPEGNGAIDVDNATDVTIPTPTAQVERAHSVIDVDVPDVTTVHAERAPSIIDVDAATHPTKEKAAEVDSPVSAPASTAPAYVTSTTQTTPRENSFPPLPTPGVEIKSPAKKDKGKEKDMVAQNEPTTLDWYDDTHSNGGLDLDDNDEDARDPDLARDIAAAKALSLGQQQDTTTPGASSSRTASSSASSSRTASANAPSSRRPAAAPGSPPKRARANTAGDAHPTAHASSPRGRIPNPSAVRTADPFNPGRIERPRYGTEDGNPPRGAFTPAPPGGWRPIFGMDSESIWLHHPTPQREMWDREPHPKFLAIPSGGNGDRLVTQRRIGEAIADRVNISPTRVLVGPPSSPESGSDARAWLIMGLPQRLAQIILDERQLCYQGITVFFFPYAPPITGFLVGFTGFTLHHSNGAPAALEYITDAISRDRTITQFVRAHRDAFPPHVDGDEAVEIFIASIGVDGMEIITTRMVDGCEEEISRYSVFNVYAVSPTDNVTRFNELRNLVGALTIHTSIHGQGRRYRNVECRICPGIDHPTPVCKLPGTDNWLGATPATIKALEDASRAARKAPGYGGSGSGSGNGRGRGRGGYGGRGGRNPRGGRGRGN